MAIMLEEIDLLDLPDIFGRMPVDYPSPTPDIGPFSEANFYEVRCGNLTKVIEFIWEGELVGTTASVNWPENNLPHFSDSRYFYYATGKCHGKKWNIFEDNIRYCYPIQRRKI